MYMQKRPTLTGRGFCPRLPVCGCRSGLPVCGCRSRLPCLDVQSSHTREWNGALRSYSQWESCLDVRRLPVRGYATAITESACPRPMRGYANQTRFLEVRDGWHGLAPSTRVKHGCRHGLTHWTRKLTQWLVQTY